MMNPLKTEIPITEYFITRFWIFLFNCVPNHSKFDNLRLTLLKLSGFNIENKVKIFSPLSISPKTKTKNIYLKGNLFINSGSRFSAPSNTKIEISKNCLIGPNVSFETVNHKLTYHDNEPRGAILGNIKLEEGVWIGSNSLLLQNIVIGKGAVIAASAVVNKSVKSFSLVGGIPAKLIRPLNEI